MAPLALQMNLFAYPDNANWSDILWQVVVVSQHRNSEKLLNNVDDDVNDAAHLN